MPSEYRRFAAGHQRAPVRWSDGTRWQAYRPGFFLPVCVLSRLFRPLFCRSEAGFPGVHAQAFLN
jgi:hypothetical protein